MVRRFLAVLYPPCEYEQTEITVRAGEELFTAHGNVIKTAGWKAVYENLDGGIEADPEDARRRWKLCGRPDPSGLKEGTCSREFPLP